MNVMEKTLNRGIKFTLFGVTLALFLAYAAGYVYAKQPAAVPTAESLTPEQKYYKQLTYAANEMQNQLERWKASPDAEQIEQDKRYTDALMSSLQQPPEELVVAQFIVENLYAAYSEVYGQLSYGEPADFEAAEKQYSLFLENAIVIKNLTQYQGLNVICH